MSSSRTTSAFLAAALMAALTGGPARAQAQMPCANEIIPLRQEIEKIGTQVKALIDKKADRAQVCDGLKRFASAEAKFIKYLTDNGAWCSVPPEALKQASAGHAHTLKMRGQACAAGPAAQKGPPPGPGLSEALGTSRAPAAAGSKSDRGTYNSLTGNPLAR